MVVISRRGKVKRVPLVSAPSSGLLPPRVSVLDVIYWSAVAKTVESADGIELQRVDFIPTELLVTDGRSEWTIDISDCAYDIAQRSGWTHVTPR